MEILVAKNAGFCQGVTSAIKLAKSIEGGCVTLGKLIHNETVIKELEQQNIKAINSIDDYKEGILLIRSHGAGKDIYEELEKRNIKYYDATCPFVKKIHKIVEEAYNSGKKIIIIGDKNHPEVLGTNGWCNYSAKIISNEQDVSDIEPNEEYCVVEQTTFDVKEYEKLLNLIKIKCNLVVNNSTICYTTTQRQVEAEEISKKCNLVLVIGSKTSSNTTKLYNICKKNCPTYLIESLADLKTVEYKNLDFVGIVAGASTPQELIMEVKNTMSESQENKTNVVVEDVKKSQSFEELFEASKKKTDKAMSVKEGKIYDVEVIAVSADGIAVSLGGKKDGFIPASEAEPEGKEFDVNNYKVGDTITAKVINNPDSKKNGTFLLSKKELEQVAIDEEKYREILLQPMFKATIEAAVPKGLTAHVGPYKIFVPSSQIKKGYVADPDLAKYVGKELRLRVIKSKKDDQEAEIEIKPRKTVYASQKVILDEEREAADKALWEFFEIDKQVEGKVVRNTDFGSFVRVNGFECLAHKSNLSYKKDIKVDDILEVGKTYTFIVLSVDKEKRQVSLGYKQLQKSLYEEAYEKYPEGSTVTGPIKSITNYGVYVLIEDGVDGLVPVSEISRKYVKTPADVCKVDDVVTAKVIKFDVAKNKITLSIKALLPEEDEVSAEDAAAANEKRAARLSKKFDTTDAPKKKSSKKKEEAEEPQTWASDDSIGSMSIGEMLKSLKELDLRD